MPNFSTFAKMKKHVKHLMALAGFLSLALGILGIFLPLLPTTPFVLLAAWFFLRSSDRMYRYLISHKHFGPMIINFQVNKAIPVHAKVISLALMWGCILFSAFYVVHIWFVRIVLLITAICVSIHILSYKTLKKQKEKA